MKTHTILMLILLTVVSEICPAQNPATCSKLFEVESNIANHNDSVEQNELLVPIQQMVIRKAKNLLGIDPAISSKNLNLTGVNQFWSEVFNIFKKDLNLLWSSREIQMSIGDFFKLSKDKSTFKLFQSFLQSFIDWRLSKSIMHSDREREVLSQDLTKKFINLMKDSRSFQDYMSALESVTKTDGQWDVYPPETISEIFSLLKKQIVEQKKGKLPTITKDLRLEVSDWNLNVVYKDGRREEIMVFMSDRIGEFPGSFGILENGQVVVGTSTTIFIYNVFKGRVEKVAGYELNSEPTFVSWSFSSNGRYALGVQKSGGGNRDYVTSIDLTTDKPEVHAFTYDYGDYIKSFIITNEGQIHASSVKGKAYEQKHGEL